MCEATPESKIESDGFETNISVRVFLTDSSHHTIVELLEFETFGQAWNEKEGVSDGITHEGLIDEFVGYHVRVSSEGLSYFLPVLYKFAMQIASRVIKVIEHFSNVIAEVVLTPLVVVTLIPIRFA